MKESNSVSGTDEKRLKDKIVTDSRKARRKFEFYESVYRGLNESGREYLRMRSGEYKDCLKDIQEMILPAVREICPTCETHCCKLCTPERSIYTAGTIGCFQFTDYMLVRCDTVLPEPRYENVEKNLCPFWKDGCSIPTDCRSYTCIHYFCDSLRKELDMKLISEHLEKLKSIMNDFSIRECMFPLLATQKMD